MQQSQKRKRTYACVLVINMMSSASMISVGMFDRLFALLFEICRLSNIYHLIRIAENDSFVDSYVHAIV
jgi:hypothetical protein